MPGQPSKSAFLVAVAISIAICVGTGVSAAGAGTEQASGDAPRYIVRLADAPLATYRGGVEGLAPTSAAARGEAKLDPTSAASQAYVRFIATKQTTLQQAMSAARGRHGAAQLRDRHANNRVARPHAPPQAPRLASLPGVASVQPEPVRRLTSDAGPAWIGAPSIWDGSATAGASGTMGEGIVAGVIDTGVNHDHPSFAARGGDGYLHRNPRGRFYGLCDPLLGKPFCNAKLIGVWDFTGTSPEDDNQHGSHTASTAVGNVVNARMIAPTITIERKISGVAPHANLITYKACIAVGCLGASLVAAIDQAVADAVDVINYSIGGGPTDPWNDADSEAFLAAREAGVFVATSAGNDGSRPETVGSPANAPWLLSVGASTHNRTYVNAVAGMTGGSTTPPGDLRGAGVTSGYGPAPIVHAADYGDAICGAPFVPGTFDGEIVICDRGVNPRVEKGTNVQLGGAGGMVLVNTQADGESTVGDAHNLPAVHLGFTAGRQLVEWVRDGGGGHTASITGSVLDESPSNGDVTAGFSSRGPNKPVPGVLKPDVTAPGVDVLAAVHTTNPLAPPEFGILSGTSMSSPHAAGAAALIRAVHRTWTPAEVQSALMTTASTGVRDDDGVRPADSFDMGAGRIDLTRAARAGLTLDVPTSEFAAANPAAGGDPTALNLASLAYAGCEGTCSWTRTVKSRVGQTTTWRATTTGPKNLKLTVSPSSFTLAPGATQTITVTADVSKLALGQWLHAALTLEPRQSPAPSTRVPIAIRTGEPLPVEAESTGTSGSTTVSVTSNVDIKDLQTVVSGLTEGNVTNELLPQDPTPLDPYDGLVGTFHILVDVPAGSRVLASEIVDTTSLDLDLFVGIDTNGDGTPQESEEICRSASDTAFESCTLASPDGGTYWIMVQNWLGFGIDEVELLTVVIAGEDAGNLLVTGPKSAKAGTPFDVTLTWDEPALEVDDVWFGFVELGSDKQHPNNAKSLFVAIRRTG